MSIYIIGESPMTEGSSALYEACRRGLTEEAQFFIVEDPDQVNKRREEDGTTPLYVAAEKGHLDIVEKLIEEGAITNEPCWNGAQALYAAAGEGHAGVVRVLLRKEVAVDHFVKKSDGTVETPLLAAVKNDAGNSECVQLLMRAGANPHLYCALKNRDNSALYHSTPFLELVKKNDKDVSILELMLKCRPVDIGNKNVLLNQETLRGNTALHIALENGNTEITSTLLLFEPCPSGTFQIMNKSDQTPLGFLQESDKKKKENTGKKVWECLASNTKFNCARKLLLHVMSRATEQSNPAPVI